MKITMPVTEAFRAIGAVSNASSKDVTRPHINGVLLRTRGKTLNIVATNGHWIALWCCELEEKHPDARVHLTDDAVYQLVKELKLIKRRWKHEVEAMDVVFDIDKKTYEHKLGIMNLELEEKETFPNYDKVIPKRRKQPTSPGFVGVGPEVFGPVFKAFEEAKYDKSEKTDGLYFEIGDDELSPVVIRSIDKDLPLIAVVMPVRGNPDRKWSSFKRPKLMLPALLKK